MLTETHKSIILATVPLLRENGVVLTKHFYERMFTHQPELKNLFNMGNQKSGKQQTALAMAVLAYAENISNPAVLMPAVDLIGHKHTSLHIQPEHYDIVGEHLLASIKEVLGDIATEDVIEAWGLAYGQLADLMIGHERSIYTQKSEALGGWIGWKDFVVKRKVDESTEITSFYLYPVEGGAVASHKPGQYLSIQVFLPELQLLQARQYSISSAPNNEYYRISVKKELGNMSLEHMGMISNHLHNNVQEGDIVQLTSPSGNFVLQDNGKNKVFISGGIGQTPLVSMLEALNMKDNVTEKLTWIHGCRNQEVMAFSTKLEKFEASCETLEKFVFFDQVENTTSQSIFQGIVDLDRIPNWELDANADYYLCGPGPFIEKQVTYLKTQNIDMDQIFFEEFGPQSLQLN